MIIVVRLSIQKLNITRILSAHQIVRRDLIKITVQFMAKYAIESELKYLVCALFGYLVLQ